MSSTITPCSEFILSEAVTVQCCSNASHRLNRLTNTWFHSGPANSPECLGFMAQSSTSPSIALQIVESASDSFQLFCLWIFLSILLSGACIGLGFVLRNQFICRAFTSVKNYLTDESDYVGAHPSDEEHSCPTTPQALNISK